MYIIHLNQSLLLSFYPLQYPLCPLFLLLPLSLFKEIFHIFYFCCGRIEWGIIPTAASKSKTKKQLKVYPGGCMGKSGKQNRLELKTTDFSEKKAKVSPAPFRRGRKIKNITDRYYLVRGIATLKPDEV